MTIKPMKHQLAFSELWGSKKKMLNFSGAGTGKTIAVIHALKTYWPTKRVLVLAPLSILRPAWGGDLDKFWPEVEYDIAYARNREKIFCAEYPAQIVITNHAAIKQIVKNDWHKGFDIVVVDEADGFRNHNSERSKALYAVCAKVDVVTLMTATPMPNTVCDLWNLVRCVDNGKRLGLRFAGFREQMCTPRAVAKTATVWVDKPQAVDVVTTMIDDIVFRVDLQDVIEMPELITRDIVLPMPSKVKRQYEEMRHTFQLELEAEGTVINAVHAGARIQKMLQILSGAIYDSEGNVINLGKERTELVLDLVEETDHSIVAFQWVHQRDALEAEAKKRDIPYAVIDGTVGVAERERIVSAYQDGKYRVLFAHPQSAGHGLTLTRGTRCIWASPTYRADIYEQFIHRIYRKGQNRRCEVIHVAYERSCELDVYRKMQLKHGNMADLLELIVNLQKEK